MAGGAGARVQIWRARGGAHVEHVVYAHDAGRFLYFGASCLPEARRTSAVQATCGGEGRAGQERT